MADVDHELRNLGKGMVQVNMRLARVLAAVEATAAEPAEASESLLPVLLDLIDAVDRTLALGTAIAPPPSRWWQRRFAPPATPPTDLTGLALARDHAVARLAAMEITPIDTSGAFDPSVHRALEREDTTDPTLAKTISTVHRTGWIRTTRDKRAVVRTAEVTVRALTTRGAP